MKPALRSRTDSRRPSHRIAAQAPPVRRSSPRPAAREPTVAPCLPPPADPIDVFLLGRLRVERSGQPLSGLTCSKARELLAYLVLHRDRAHRREALADRLWGGDGAAEPRKALRQALWHLQSALGDAVPLVEAIGSDWIRIAAAANLRLDLARFEAAWAELEEVPERELASSASPRARATLALYRGELLEGSSWDWCLLERTRLRDMFLALADRVMSGCLALEKPAAGVRLGFEILRHDPARERTHQQLMSMQLLAGDRGAALRQYERCVAALRDELGVEPCRATRELVARIRGGPSGVEADAAFRLLPAAEPQVPAVGVLERLRQLRALLSEARHEVHAEIQALERALEAARSG